jgi:hypothetical protein
MTPTGITLLSGQSAIVKIDAGILAAAAQMATQIVLGPSGVATLASTTGASVDIGPDIQAKSPAGSTMKIDGNIGLAAIGGAKLDLSTDAKMKGATAECKGSGAKITLDTNAQVTGAMASMAALGEGAGQVKADPSGVTMQGAKVGIAGSALTSILAPLVKVN